MAPLIAAEKTRSWKNGASQDIALLLFPLGVLALAAPDRCLPSPSPQSPATHRADGSVEVPARGPPTTGALGQVRFSP
jgi:hypothetical protein